MSDRHRQARTIIFLGISGSGKGTQAAKLLKALPRAKQISTGEGLRRMALRKNLVGGYIREILNHGNLAPYWAPTSIWLSEFLERLKGDEPLVFDGAPRRIEEAKMLDDFMKDVGRPAPFAVYLRVSQRSALRRLLERGRSDDNRRAIAARFRFFRTDVHPVIRYYQHRTRLAVINGDQSVEDVWRDIKKALRLR